MDNTRDAAHIREFIAKKGHIACIYLNSHNKAYKLEELEGRLIHKNMELIQSEILL